MNDIKMLSVSLESIKLHERHEAYIHVPHGLSPSDAGHKAWVIVASTSLITG